MDDDDDPAPTSAPSSAPSSAVDRNKMSVEKTAEFMKGKQTAVNKKNEALLTGVINVLSDEQKEIEEELRRELERKQALEARRKMIGIVELEGHLDKRSPSHKIWQSRWFKLSTRENESGDYNPDADDDYPFYVHTLMWFKNKGGLLANSIDCATITTIAVIQCSRPIAFVKGKDKLVLDSEVLGQV